MDVFGLFVLPTWLGLLLLVIFLYVFHMSSTHNTFRKMGIPGPIPIPLIGNAIYTIKTGVFQTVVNGYRHFQHQSPFYGVFEGRTPILTITDMGMIEDIMVKQFDDFPNRRTYASMDQRLLKDIMFNLNDMSWKNHRTLLRPSLAPARLKEAYPRIEKVLKSLLDAMETRTKANNYEIEFADIIGCFAMDVIAGLGFDVDTDSLNNSKNPFIHGARDFMEMFDVRTLGFEFLCPKFMKRLFDYFDIGIVSKKMVYFLRDYIDKAIAERTAEGFARDKGDLFQYFIDHSVYRSKELDKTSKRPRKLFTKDELYAIGIAFFIAGYDTLAKGIFYNIYLLVMHPEFCKRATKEVEEVLQGEFPNPDNVKKLTYTNRCIKEGLRILPIGQFTERTTRADTYLRGHFIPKDMIVRIPLAGVLRDERFFDNPDEYNPDNFLPENCKDRPKFAYMPFGNGPRGCFGYTLAILLVKVCTAAFLQRFTLSPCARSEYPVRLSKVSDLVPAMPLYLHVKPKKPVVKNASKDVLKSNAHAFAPEATKPETAAA